MIERSDNLPLRLRILYALTAGLLAFFLSTYNISYEIGDTTVNIPWSLIFPVLIALAFGPIGATITAISGGALFPFYLWPENGYANFLTSLTLFGFYLMLGYLSNKRNSLRKHRRLMLAIIVSALSYAIFLFLAYRYGYNAFLKLNPAFWVDNSIDYLPPSLLVRFFVKNIINYFLIAQFAEAVLHLPFPRKMFGLTYYGWMRGNTRVFMLSIAIALSAWGAFYFLDYLLESNEQVVRNYIPLSFMVLFWSGGFVGRVLIYSSEQRLKASDALQLKQDELDTVVQNIPSVVYRCIADKNWTILMISNKIKDITGYAADDFIDNKYRTFASIIYEDDQDEIKHQLLDALNSRKEFELEYRIVDKNNKTHWVSDKGVVKYNENLSDWIIDGVIHDITDKKNTQIILENYRDRLEQLVDERTKELNLSNSKLEKAFEDLKAAQSRLVQSEKMSSLGVLTAGVAHEINNPLNFIIRGYEGIKNYLTKSNLIKTAHNTEFLRSIENGVERTSQIIKGLNQFSRNNEDFNEVCDIHGILNNTVSILHGQLKHKVEIQKYFPDENITVKGNVGKLHQVFINVIMNAVQSIEKKGVIVLSAKAESDYVIVGVADTGRGISPDDIKKIFDPFFTTKAPGEGTGLGLSISYSIIEEHHGKIEVESKLGTGTSMKIYLPLLTP